MLRLKIVILSASIFFSTSSNASEIEEAKCEIYGTMGASVLGVMLPTTIEDLIKMIRGENPSLLGNMTKAILNSVSDSTVGQLDSIAEEDMALLGEAAGQQVMALAMSGQVITEEDAYRALSSTCRRVTSDKILEQMKAAKAALSVIQ